MAQLVRGPARRAGDPGSNPGSGENLSIQLLIIIVLLLPEALSCVVGLVFTGITMLVAF